MDSQHGQYSLYMALDPPETPFNGPLKGNRGLFSGTPLKRGRAATDLRAVPGDERLVPVSLHAVPPPLLRGTAGALGPYPDPKRM